MFFFGNFLIPKKAFFKALNEKDGKKKNPWIEETIRELSASMSIVIVTHNMQQAARVSDYTGFFLSDGGPGRLIESGTTADIFTNPKEKKTEDYVSGRFG